MSAGAVFEQLPEAPAPPRPNEPGGSAGRYDTGRWKPEKIEVWRREDLTTFEGYITLQTAAELFDVQRERLQVACWRGSLPGKKIPAAGRAGNGQWLVHPGDVARYLATTLRGVTNRRRADELSPQRAERERARLLASAAAADERARRIKEQLAALGPAPDRAAVGDLTLRLAKEESYVANRRRVADGLTRRQRDRAEAEARAAADPPHVEPADPEPGAKPDA